MAVSFLTMETLRRELAMCIQQQTDESGLEIYPRLSLTLSGDWHSRMRLAAELDKQTAEVWLYSADLTMSLDDFADRYLVPISKVFSPVSPDLGVFAQFAS